MNDLHSDCFAHWTKHVGAEAEDGAWNILFVRNASASGWKNSKLCLERLATYSSAKL